MSYPHGNRTFSRRAALLIALAALVAGALITWALTPTNGTASRQAANSAVAVSTNNAPVQPTTTDPTSNAPYSTDVVAKALSEEHGKLYMCMSYPPIDKRTLADMVPTHNVIVMLTYNTAKGKYVVTQSDARISISQSRATFQGDNGAYPVQILHLGYADGVELFQIYEREQNGNWYVAGPDSQYDPTSLTLDASTVAGTNNPIVMIVAADTNNCANSNQKMPNGFSWKWFAEAGTLVPWNYNVAE